MTPRRGAACGGARPARRRRRTPLVARRPRTLAGVAPAPVPSATTRWRCGRCGNLTRFDVVRTSRAREFVHLDLAGESSVEEREVLSDTVESVRCRWCDADDTVELVDRPTAGRDAAGRSGSEPAGAERG